jgi:hypothetical protein
MNITKRIFIFSLIVTFISGGLVGLFFYLQNNLQQKIDSEYTETNFTVVGYSVAEQQCKVCIGAPCIPPSHVPCSYCNWVPWSSYAVLSYTAIYNGTLRKYKASIDIDCGTTSSNAMQNAQHDPFYPMKSNITGWYLNQSPNIYDLNDPAPYTYFPGIVIFTVSGTSFLFVAGAVLVQTILDTCNSGCKGQPDEGSDEADEESPLQPSKYN